MTPRSRSGGLLVSSRMRQMGECAQADYPARFVADWSRQRLYGERCKQARLHR